MNEIDKMRSCQLADMEDPEIQASFIHAKKLLAKFRMMNIYDEEFREILEDLVPGIPATSTICPPFHCDHGHLLHISINQLLTSYSPFLAHYWHQPVQLTIVLI